MSEQVYLTGAGSLPGIPGVLGPGLYEIDYDARTATPVPYIPATVEATPALTVDTYTEYYTAPPLVDSTTVQTQDQTTTTTQQ
jgi:hypothetical protein